MVGRNMTEEQRRRKREKDKGKRGKQNGGETVNTISVLTISKFGFSRVLPFLAGNDEV